MDNKLKATVTSSPYSYDWYTTTVADGTHTLKAESYDAAGNFNIAMYAVTVQNGTAADTVPPTVSITSPSNNATVSGKVNFAATATDNVGVYKVDFYLDNATKLGTATVSPYAISWDTIVASAGTHTLSVRAYDAAGNIGLNSMTVSVNNSGSQVIVTPSPCTGYGYGSWSGCKSDGTQSRSIISYIPAGCLATTAGSATPDVLVRNCTVCAYACKDWGACVSGSKSRICPATPASCIAPEDQSQIPSLQQSCTASVVACTDYTYGSWSSCVSGKQTRTITSQSPSGCSDTSGAVLGQDCDSSVPCSSYSYGSWSGCDSAGKQARKVILSVPAGCVGGVIPVLEQGCSFQNVPCVYTYSDWGNCGSNSIQTRKIISVLPEKCSKDIAPVLEQKCDYMPPRPIQENIASSTLAEIKIPCDYSYSAWGACVLKRQTRMVVSSLPRDCDSSAIPVTSRDCVESSATALPAIAVDAPIPAPAAVLSAAPKTAANLNDRTDPQWQQYYFGAPDCQDAKICAGAADPDNDGLVNNEEYRFGTNPKSPDTDRDGMVDGNEIQNGRNPLVADSKKVSDAVIYESPKDKGQELDQIYKVDNVEMIKTSAGVKNLKITGKGLPNSYVTIYVYSDPIVLTVKTDADGNWSYTLDKPMEDGNHEVYVAVNDNAGKVIAKSTPLPFVQTAEAATVTYPKNLASPDRAPAPTRSRLWEGYLIFFMAGLGGLVLVLIAIGFAKNSRNE